MKKFLKPTKVKVILTILLFILSALFYGFFVLNFFGITLINWCIPDIPGGPVPTYPPFSLSKTISDIPHLLNPLPIGNYGNVMCMADPSAQVAGYIVDVTKILAIILYAFLLYIIVCTITSLRPGSGKQKTNQSGKVKK